MPFIRYVEKLSTAGQAAGNNIAQGHCMLIPKATDTFIRTFPLLFPNFFSQRAFRYLPLSCLIPIFLNRMDATTYNFSEIRHLLSAVIAVFT